MKPTSKQVVQGAILLTIAGLISKILSATYRIPLQNLTGDLGFYLYQQVYPFIGTVMILSLYGFPVAISSLVVETKQKGQALSWRQFFMPLWTVLSIINGLLFLVIFLSAPLIAKLSGEPSFTALYQTVAFLFLLVPIVAILRGTFQGLGEMTQTAYSQILEQLVRVSIIIGASYLVFRGELHVSKIGFYGILASIAGLVVVSIYLLVVFMKRKVIESENIRTERIHLKYIFTICVTLGIVASINQLILIFIQLIDVISLVPNLIDYGFNVMEARTQKGIFDRGLPLIQFGVVFGSSFALALVPALTTNSNKESNLSQQTAKDALSLSFYISSAATVGLICIMPEANLLLFMDRDGSFSLQILSFSILLTSIAITGSAILLSERRWKPIIFGIILMIITKYVLNEWLVPIYAITGSAMATVISLTIFFIVILSPLKNISLLRSINLKAFLLATSGMIVFLISSRTIIYPLFPSTRLSLLCYVLFIVLLGAFIYMYLLIRHNGFSVRQINNLPFSTLLLKFLPK